MNIPGNERVIRQWNHSVSEATRIALKAKALPSGTVIFPKIGAAIATNKKRILITPSCVDNNVMGVTPNSTRLATEYLFHLFDATDLSRFASASNPPSIRKSEIANWIIRVPPLYEQRQIASLLDRAADIRRRADAARVKARAIIPALFLDMFGDPSMTPSRWPITTVAAAGEVKLGRQRAPKYQTGQFTKPYVRVANVFEDRIDVSDLLSMDFDDRDFAVYRLAPGDILLNEGQSIELVGRPAMWRDEVKDCCFQNTLVRFRCDTTLIVPEFALATFLWMYRTGQLSHISSKTSNVAHLGASRLAKLPMMLPPLSLQIAFAQKAQSLEAIARALDTAATKAEAMAAALSAQVFG